VKTPTGSTSAAAVVQQVEFAHSSILQFIVYSHDYVN